jgi:hypothetical protein
MTTLYLIFDLIPGETPQDSNEVFYGTVEQADDCYGLRIGADEDDLLGFAKRMGWTVFKQVG